MLRIILDAIPHVIAAALILAVAHAIGKFASRLLTRFLGTTGFDRAVGATGLWRDGASGGFQPSKLVGNGVFVAVLIFGLMEAFRQLNFAYGSRIMAEVLALFGQVVFGSVIIFAAVVIARLIARAIESNGQPGTRAAAPVVRIGIIVLGTAIGLRFMGLADDIINMAFGLLFGAVAVAFALAFGLGGREPARRAVARLLKEDAGSAVRGDRSGNDRPNDAFDRPTGGPAPYNPLDDGGM